MPNYTPHEIIDMILILEECRGNYRAGSKLYRERYRGHHSQLFLTRQGQLVRSRAQRGLSQTIRLTVLTAVTINPNINV